MNRNPFLIAAVAIVLLALGLREYFVLTMTVPEPNQGEVGDYLRYALHMAWDGTFSNSEGAPVPDAYRSPGYPTLLLLLFPGEWESGRWFAAVYQAQALLGAATVAGVIALARLWLSRGFALIAGGLLAIQPHHVAATGALLPETLSGALIVAALLALACAVRRKHWPLGVLSGLLMGMGLLTTPILGMLPIVLLPLLWRQARAPALAMAATALLMMGAWTLRNAVVHAEGSHWAAVEFVRGSWPEYHRVAKSPWRWPATDLAIRAETTAIQKSPADGLRQVAARMSKQPGRYARWYLSKPWLLFDWEVRVGHGMIYVVTMRDTVLDRGAGLAMTVMQWKLNSLLFLLAFGGWIVALLRGGSSRLVAVAVLYFTVAHVVLQAEPRNAIPYRPLEILLALTAVAWVWTKLPGSAMRPQALVAE